MGKIHVKDISIYAYHGCLDEESKIGSYYKVNIWVTANLAKSIKSDELSDTVDYVLINRIVKQEMAVRSKLLEHVASRILNGIFEQSQIVTMAKVSVSKCNPPIGGDVPEVEIILKRKR